MLYKKQELLALRKDLNWARFLVGSVLLIFLVCCVVLLYIFTFIVPCCEIDVRYDFLIQRCSVYVFTSSCLRDLCLCIVVSNTYWLYEWHDVCPIRARNYLPFAGAWVHPRLFVRSVLLISLVFCVMFFILFVFVLCFVYPMLPVSLDCPFLIAASVFSNV